MAHDELAGTNVRASVVRPGRWGSRFWPRSIVRRGLLSLAALALVMALFAGWYAYTLRADYRETKANIEAVRAMLPSEGSGEQLEPEQLPELADRLALIEAQIRHLDDRLHVPLVTNLALHTPWAGDRVRALEAFLAFGINASTLAHDGAELGREIYVAWETTSFSGPVDPDSPTWLGTVRENRGSIDELLLRFDNLLVERENLSEEHLPGKATNMLATLDPLLLRAAEIREKYIGLLDYVPVVEQALGAEEDGRYIVLLLNSQEIRPMGGFPGTYAVITVVDGRLAGYEFHSILELDRGYLEHRTTPVPAPAPLARHLKVKELFPRDTGWEPDFQHAAATLLAMYALTGDEPVQGVVAVTDIAVRNALRVLGPLTVMIEGEPVTVDDENVISTIEGYRDFSDERHKDVVRIIGSALLDRIRTGGFDVQRDILGSIRDSADRREIQLYAVDPTLQAEVVAQGWDGALVPDPAVPTLGLTLANIVGNKASYHLNVSSNLRFAQLPDGTTRVTWVIDIEHAGNPGGNPVYNGFHRTWLAIYRPAGSTLVLSRPEPESPPLSDDPRAEAYHLELFPEESEQVRITFDLPPGTTELRLRRQPGANSIDIDFSGAGIGCEFDTRLTLHRDAIVDLDACVVESP